MLIWYYLYDPFFNLKLIIMGSLEVSLLPSNSCCLMTLKITYWACNCKIRQTISKSIAIKCYLSNVVYLNNCILHLWIELSLFGNSQTFMISWSNYIKFQDISIEQSTKFYIIRNYLTILNRLWNGIWISSIH